MMSCRVACLGVQVWGVAGLVARRVLWGVGRFLCLSGVVRVLGIGMWVAGAWWRWVGLLWLGLSNVARSSLT